MHKARVDSPWDAGRERQEGYETSPYDGTWSARERGGLGIKSAGKMQAKGEGNPDA